MTTVLYIAGDGSWGDAEGIVFIVDDLNDDERELINMYGQRGLDMIYDARRAKEIL